MSFIYKLVFGLTLFETILVFLLLLPLEKIPLGKIFQSKLIMFLIEIQKNFRIVLFIIFAIVLLLLADSIITIKNGVLPNKIPQGFIFDPYLHCKIFYAERNSYLMTITLIMGFILVRVPKMILYRHN